MESPCSTKRIDALLVKMAYMASSVNPPSIIAQRDSVLAQYRRVSEPDEIGGHGEIEPEEMRALMTRRVAAIERSAPAGTAYARAASAVFEEDAADSWYLRQLVGVVRALRKDYVGGYMRTVEDLIHAGVFDDFLDMANELLAKGYKDPAAVLGGSVLEEHLRKLASRAGVAIASGDKPKRTDLLNALTPYRCSSRACGLPYRCRP